jgi:DNA-directed RNA polymerase delta subunit
MNLTQHFQGYFNLSQEEKELKLVEITDFYINQMHSLDRPLSDIIAEIDEVIELSKEKENFEITQGYQDLKEALQEVLDLFNKFFNKQ